MLISITVTTTSHEVISQVQCFAESLNDPVLGQPVIMISEPARAEHVPMPTEEVTA